MSSERKNITQPADWWAAFEDQAKREGKSLSEWVGDCCTGQLPQRIAKTLSARPAVGAPKK